MMNWESMSSHSSLRANGSRERAPDDRLREAIQALLQQESWIASSLALLAMTISNRTKNHHALDQKQKAGVAAGFRFDPPVNF
jgi:hypothetical protein